MFEFIVTAAFATFVWKLVSKKRAYNLGDPIQPIEYPESYEWDFEIDVNELCTLKGE